MLENWYLKKVSWEWGVCILMVFCMLISEDCIIFVSLLNCIIFCISIVFIFCVYVVGYLCSVVLVLKFFGNFFKMFFVILKIILFFDLLFLEDVCDCVNRMLLKSKWVFCWFLLMFVLVCMLNILGWVINGKFWEYLMYELYLFFLGVK